MHGQILLVGAQGYIPHVIKLEELKKFYAIDEYFDSLVGKAPIVTVNNEIGRNVEVSKSIISEDTGLPVVAFYEHPGYFPQDTGFIIGDAMSKVARRATEWIVSLRDVIVNVNNESLLFKTLSVKIDPCDIVPTSINTSDYYRL